MNKLTILLMLALILTPAISVIAETKSATLIEQTDKQEKKTYKVFCVSSSDAEVPAKGMKCKTTLTLLGKDGISALGGADIAVDYQTESSSGSSTASNGQFWYVARFSMPYPIESVLVPITITLTRNEDGKDVIYKGVYNRTQYFSHLQSVISAQTMVSTGSGVYELIFETPGWATVYFSGEVENLFSKPGNGTIKPTIDSNQAIYGGGECGNSHFLCGNPNIPVPSFGRTLVEMQVSASGTFCGNVIYVLNVNQSSLQSDQGRQPSKAILCESSNPSGNVKHFVEWKGNEADSPISVATMYTNMTVGSPLLAKKGIEPPRVMKTSVSGQDSDFGSWDLSSGDGVYLETTISKEAATTCSFDIYQKSSGSISSGKGTANAKVDIAGQGQTTTTVREYEPAL